MAHRISTVVQQDHVAIKAIYDQIIQSPDDKHKIQYQNLFTWELARHLVGEELVLFPALEKELPEGKSLADSGRSEHHQIKEKLKAFQSMKPSDPHFMESIQTIMLHLARHMEGEENSDLVQLENTVSAKESEKLGKSFGRTKFFAPTRSHPGAPSKPPFETVVGLLTAPVDNLTDMFRKWPDAPASA